MPSLTPDASQSLLPHETFRDWRPARRPLAPLCGGGGMFGQIHNPMSYNSVAIPGSGRRPFLGIAKVPDYEFTNGANPKYPGYLTWQHPDGYFIQPDRHFITDFMTNPGPHRIFMPRDRYPAAVLFHDSICKEHCAYRCPTLTGRYVRILVNPDTAALWLNWMMRCSGAWAINGESTELAVKLFGPRW